MVSLRAASKAWRLGGISWNFWNYVDLFFSDATHPQTLEATLKLTSTLPQVYLKLNFNTHPKTPKP